MIGLTPLEVDAMSLWQFSAAVDGWNRAHAERGKDELSVDEAAAIGAHLDATYGT